MSQISALLRELKDNPKNFCLDYAIHPFCLIHKPSKIEIWIASGFSFYRIHKPYSFDFGFWDLFRFHFALKKWKKQNEPIPNLVANWLKTGLLTTDKK